MEDEVLSDAWIQISEKVLDQIEHLEETEKKDRLDLVRSIRFVLRALNRSLLGWLQWVDNPEVMTRFTKEDLEKMNKRLSEFTRSFIEYDLEATKLGDQKGLKIIKKVRKRKMESAEVTYVA